MYRLNQTLEFSKELTELLARDEWLEQVLVDELYPILKRHPHRGGSYSRRLNCWVMRRHVLMRMMIIQVYYQISRDEQRVDLLSICEVSQTAL